MISKLFNPKYSLTWQTYFVALVFFVTFGGQAFRYALGWVGYTILISVVFLASVIIFRKSFHGFFRRTPRPLTLFIAFCSLSIVWSTYKPATLLGSIIQIAPAIVAVLFSSLTWQTLARALEIALKSLIGVSLIMELFVALFSPSGLYPFVDSVKGYHWIDGLLLQGGPIQGIMGNRNLLAFAALLLLIVVFVRFLQDKTKWFSFVIWVTVIISILALTRSATVTLAVVALTLLVGFIYLMRAFLPKRHRYLYILGGGTVLAALALSIIYSSTLFSLVGRDDDLSGRTTIWRSVWHLIEQKPLVGWGWVGYWNPWFEPFKNLAIINHTQYLQAHDTFLDIVFQVGIIGGALALCVAIVASVRAWRLSVSPVMVNGSVLEPFEPLTLLPVLLLAALLIQSLTESRLLIEGDWLLFVLICCKVKVDAPPYGSLRKK